MSNLIIKKIRSVSVLYNQKGAKSRMQDRKGWAFLLKYEGETIYRTHGKDFLSDAHHMAVLPKGASYEWTCTQTGHALIVEFDSDIEFCEPIILPIKDTERILRALREMERKQNLRSHFSELEGIRDAYSIILMALQSQADQYTPPSKRQKIAPAIEYLSTSYAKKITNEELAKQLGISTVYFRKLFTEVVGVSPIAYARRLRIEKAREMLKSDYGSLSDVAYSLGYTSLYDFSRDFKKHTGIAPSKYST